MRNRRKGFSLVESIVSVSLAALFSLSTVSILPGNVLMERRSLNSYKVTGLGQNLLQEQLALPFESLAVGSSRDLGTVTREGLKIRARVRVLSAPGASDRYREVRVELNWNEGGRVRTMILEGGVCAR
ncbi:MAG: hypothetical protein AB1758_33260 [Candidatus Eremiobacterota bacterium]